MANKNFIVKNGLEVTGSITATGNINGNNDYTLPEANASTLGGIKIGSGLTMTAGVASVSVSGFPTGKKIPFFEASAPTGWTQDTTNTDAALRVVSGTGGGTGGSAGFSSPAHSLSGGAHTLTIAEMPSHNHNIDPSPLTPWGHQSGSGSAGYAASWGTKYTESTGGGGSHSHSLSGSITTPKYVDMIICSKDA